MILLLYRHIIASSLDSSSIKEYALILDAEFGPKGYNVTIFESH